MASGSDHRASAPPLGRSPSGSLMDPTSSPRLKALIVSLEAWNTLRQLLLRSHELISVGHLNRIDNVPSGLYPALDTVRDLESNFSTMLIRYAQLPDPIHIACFAKTFSERIFHAGDVIETSMVSVLAMAANTRAVFRSQVMDLDAALNEYEATVYAGVASSTYGRARVQKVFLPQPPPLQYVPGALEPYLNPAQVSATGESRVEFAIPLVYLRNRRTKLLELMQTLCESHSPDFTSLDVRDYHHEMELIEIEIALVTSLQRLLTTVRMLEEGGPNNNVQNVEENRVSDTLREIAQLVLSSRYAFAPTPRNPPGPAALPDGVRNFVGRDFNPTDNLSRSSSAHRNLSAYGTISPALNNRANVTTHNNRSSSARDLTSGIVGQPNLWGIGTNDNIGPARIRNPTVTRGRWFTEHRPTSNSGSAFSGDAERERNRDFPDVLYNNSEHYQRLRIPPTHQSNTSAFIRITRPNPGNITTPSALRSRASSVADISEFGSRGNESETSYHSVPTRTLTSVWERQNVLLQEISSRLSRLEMTVRANADMLNRTAENITDLTSSVEQMTQQLNDTCRDVSMVKSRVNSALFETALSHSWRNLDNTLENSWRIRSEEGPMNISARSWGPTRHTNIRTSEGASGGNRRSSDRYNFSGSLPMAAERGDDPGASQYDVRGSSNSHLLLNNQMPPGNRANNYWDNFKSYSRLNLLSDSKANIPILSPSAAVEGHSSGSFYDDVYRVSSPSARRDSRERLSSAGATRSALSSNFVENIGQKKRNKDQKKQLAAVAPNSPEHSTSSNSSAADSLRDAMLKSSTSVTPRNMQTRMLHSLPISRDRETDTIASLLEATTIGTSPTSNNVVEARNVIEPGARNATAHASSASSLEVDVVSRDEFLELNSGAGSSSSGNGKSDDGGPSSTSSKRELEKFIPSDLEQFSRNNVAGSLAANWQVDLNDGAHPTTVSKPEETEWDGWSQSHQEPTLRDVDQNSQNDYTRPPSF